MKINIFVRAAILFCVTISFIMVDYTDGKWTGMIATPDGNEYPVHFTFKTGNGKLTGTSQQPQGVADLTEGHVEGDSLVFAFDNNGTQVWNNGIYYPDGDSISLNIDYQGLKFHSTLRRDTDNK